MYCENCGKKLIRGYQFCLECGTPVPPEATEEEPVQTAEADSYTGPRTEPLDGGEGSLVFCATCGMHMQTSTSVCEKCGQPLSGVTQPAQQQSSVPLYNVNPSNDLGGGIGGFDGIGEVNGLTDEDISQLDSFVSGYESSIGYDLGSTGGAMDSIGGPSIEDIDSLNHQLADLSNTYSTMPEIGADTSHAYEMPSAESAYIPPVEEPKVEETYTEPVALEKPVELEANPTLVLEDMSLAEDPSKDVDSLLMADDPAMVAKSVELSDDSSYEQEPLEINPAYVVPDVSLNDNFDYSGTDMTAEPVVEESYAAPAEEYNEPVAEDVYTPAEDTYTEPVAEEIYTPAEDTYTEPVAEEIYTPAEDTYTEPVAEEILAPVEDTYTEPVAEEILAPAEDTYTEPVAEEIPAPVEDAYTEPVAEEIFTPAEDTYTEPAADAAAAFAASDFLAEEKSSYTEPAYSAAAATAVADDEDEDEEIDLGALIYCRNCGQDMYEKETVCRNCGAPKREAYQPPRVRATQKKEPWKLFGVFGIPSLVGAGLLVILVIVLVLTTNTGTTSNITGNEQLNASNTTTAATTTTPAESEPAEVTTTAPATTTTPKEEEVTTAPAETTTKPAESSTTPAESEPAETTATTPESSAATSATTPTATTKPAATTTTKATTTVATTTVTPSDYTPSTAIRAENAQRDAIYDALDLMTAEMGKLNLFANLTTDEIDRYGSIDTVFRRDHIKAMQTSIKSGKSAVDSAVSAAKSKASSFGSAVKSLQSLHTIYTNYYNYVMSPTSSFVSKTSDYTSSYYSGLSALMHTKLQTSAQSTADKNAYYADIMNRALTAAKNAQSSYKTVQAKFTALPSGSFDTKALELLRSSAVNSTYMKAAGYAYEVEVYTEILGSAPSAYSSAYSQLCTINDQLVTLNSEIQYSPYSTLATFKSETNGALSALSSAISKLDSMV